MIREYKGEYGEVHIFYMINGDTIALVGAKLEDSRNYVRLRLSENQIIDVRNDHVLFHEFIEKEEYEKRGVNNESKF